MNSKEQECPFTLRPFSIKDSGGFYSVLYAGYNFIALKADRKLRQLCVYVFKPISVEGTQVYVTSSGVLLHTIPLQDFQPGRPLIIEEDKLS